ncbi:MAG: GNAT family N-acetyltransferase [Neisseria sp.]|nr:GNAT family N-acetyltransferase [Neisseria sp.]
MSMLTLLRPARPSDCEDIFYAHQFSVEYTCRRTYDEAVRQAWLALLDVNGYLAAMESPTCEVWVVEYNGAIQGFFQLNLKEATLDALYVHPFVQNHGLGTALLQRAEELAAKADLSFLKLYASTNSIGFYKLNGYESLGEYALPLNPEVSVDCELMRKYL